MVSKLWIVFWDVVCTLGIRWHTPSLGLHASCDVECVHTNLNTNTHILMTIVWNDISYYATADHFAFNNGVVIGCRSVMVMGMRFNCWPMPNSLVYVVISHTSVAVWATCACYSGLTHTRWWTIYRDHTTCPDYHFVCYLYPVKPWCMFAGLFTHLRRSHQDAPAPPIYQISTRQSRVAWEFLDHNRFTGTVPSGLGALDTPMQREIARPEDS